MLRMINMASHSGFVQVNAIILLVFSFQSLFASPFELKLSSSEELEAYIEKRTELIQAEPKTPYLT